MHNAYDTFASYMENYSKKVGIKHDHVSPLFAFPSMVVSLNERRALRLRTPSLISIIPDPLTYPHLHSHYIYWDVIVFLDAFLFYFIILSYI